MLIEEAIKHCEEKAKCGDSCGREHKQLADWLRELMQLRCNLAIREANACKERDNKVIHHKKYKLCLAMAQVLKHVCPITNRKAKWRDKFHKRWLELSEKFKEEK